MCKNYIETIKDIVSTSKNQSFDILKKELILQYVNKSLEDKIKEFLLELGRGFAFVARMYNDLEKVDKDNTVVKYSVLNENENLFVSKYQLYLPTEDELRAEIERDVLGIYTQGLEIIRNNE